MHFHPQGAIVPEERRTERVLLRPLRVSDVDLDYDAVMSSAEQLRRWSQSPWPADDFTVAENREDLERHEREHLVGEAFTFTVLDPRATRCLGCVYLTPLRPRQEGMCEGATHACNVGFWVRTSELAHDLDRHLLATLREWLAAEWAFDATVFTIAQQEARQAELFRDAGLEMRLAFTLEDGRARWSFA